MIHIILYYIINIILDHIDKINRDVSEMCSTFHRPKGKISSKIFDNQFNM